MTLCDLCANKGKSVYTPKRERLGHMCDAGKKSPFQEFIGKGQEPQECEYYKEWN